MTKDNHKLGQFDLTGIPPAPRGSPQISVEFVVDANGILTVSAEDKGTGKSEKVTIKAEKGRLSEEDIERMVKEAEEFADSDKKLKEKVDAKNALETFAFNAKQSAEDPKVKGELVVFLGFAARRFLFCFETVLKLYFQNVARPRRRRKKDAHSHLHPPLTRARTTTTKNQTDKLDEGDRKKVVEAVKEALEWLEERGADADPDDVNDRRKELEDVVQPIMAKIYAAGGGPGGGGDGADSHDEL